MTCSTPALGYYFPTTPTIFLACPECGEDGVLTVHAYDEDRSGRCTLGTGTVELAEAACGHDVDDDVLRALAGTEVERLRKEIP